MGEILTEIKLTEFTKGGGCGCKISPAELQKILAGVNRNADFSNLIVGNSTSDDAAVYDIGNGQYLISTTDFFTPIVDSPFDFGRIAATNALSDVYAMGGKPVMALAVLGYPSDKLKPGMISDILNGASEICHQAGIPVAGGHTIESADLFFGLSVNGLVHADHLKRNNTAKEGDYIFMTKPLGVGILSSALKRKQISEEDHLKMLNCMTRLNLIGETLGKEKGVHAMTDVTGFGLLGHLLEVCKGSNVSAEINFTDVPLISNLDVYLDKFIYPDMTTRVFSSVSNDVSELNAGQLFILCDPQTSGGLLVCVDEKEKDNISSLLASSGLSKQFCTPIGRITKKAEKDILVK